MSAPVVSIIIPTYNHAHFLRAALDSVQRQTFTAWEVIIVNNHSTDNTITVVESYNDPRIRLVNFANNGVIAASRNYGLQLTHAPYVAFLDSDDTWYPEKLALCMVKLQQGYDVVCHAEVWVGPEKRRRTVIYGPESRAAYASLLFEGNCISTSAVVAERDLVAEAGGFSENSEFITAEDYELWLTLAHNGARIGFLDEVLGEYLIHEGNQSRAALRNMQAVLAVFEHHLATRIHSPQPLRTKRRKAIIYYGGARGLQSCGQFGDAWRYFLQAVMEYPLVPKFYAAMLLNALHRRH